MQVIIDGIEYVPEGEIPELTDDRLRGVLEVLTEILYFREEHKAIPRAWNALNILAPELAALPPDVAYDRVHGEEDE